MVMWNAVRLLRAASPRRGIYREREDRPFLNCISNNSSYSNIILPILVQRVRARVNGPGRGVSREQRATTSDSLYVCTVSAATLPIYRDDEFRGHFDVPIPIEIHRLLPEIPVNGGPVPTMMRLPAIHDQV